MKRPIPAHNPDFHLLSLIRKNLNLSSNHTRGYPNNPDNRFHNKFPSSPTTSSSPMRPPAFNNSTPTPSDLAILTRLCRLSRCHAPSIGPLATCTQTSTRNHSRTEVFADVSQNLTLFPRTQFLKASLTKLNPLQKIRSLCLAHFKFQLRAEDFEQFKQEVMCIQYVVGRNAIFPRCKLVWFSGER